MKGIVIIVLLLMAWMALRRQIRVTAFRGPSDPGTDAREDRRRAREDARRREGEVTIDRHPDRPPGEGDFADYEEIR